MAVPQLSTRTTAPSTEGLCDQYLLRDRSEFTVGKVTERLVVEAMLGTLRTREMLSASPIKIIISFFSPIPAAQYNSYIVLCAHHSSPSIPLGP